MVQARQLGDELYVGVHSDEDILANKGPTVMNLDERFVFSTTTHTHTHSSPLVSRGIPSADHSSLGWPLLMPVDG